MKIVSNPAYEAAIYEVGFWSPEVGFMQVAAGFAIRSNDPECLEKLMRGEITVDDTIPPFILVPDEHTLPESDKLPRHGFTDGQRKL